MSRIGHEALRYMLVVPLIVAIMLGILVDGAFKYSMAVNHERAAFEIRLSTMTLKQLSQQEI